VIQIVQHVEFLRQFLEKRIAAHRVIRLGIQERLAQSFLNASRAWSGSIVVSTNCPRPREPPRAER
jgi:hypothetical protein